MSDDSPTIMNASELKKLADNYIEMQDGIQMKKVISDIYKTILKSAQKGNKSYLFGPFFFIRYDEYVEGKFEKIEKIIKLSKLKFESYGYKCTIKETSENIFLEIDWSSS
jgi:hypothetical protein